MPCLPQDIVYCIAICSGTSDILKLFHAITLRDFLLDLLARSACAMSWRSRSSEKRCAASDDDSEYEGCIVLEVGVDVERTVEWSFHL
jgi:hypothetical protein